MPADPKPLPSPDDEINFDDDEIYSGRGKATRGGGTWQAEGGDSGKLGPPAEILSGENGPSDPDQGGKPQAGDGKPGAA